MDPLFCGKVAAWAGPHGSLPLQPLQRFPTAPTLSPLQAEKPRRVRRASDSDEGPGKCLNRPKHEWSNGRAGSSEAAPRASDGGWAWPAILGCGRRGPPPRPGAAPPAEVRYARVADLVAAGKAAAAAGGAAVERGDLRGLGGRRPQWAGMKKAQRALEKAVRCYGDDVDRLCDIVRQVVYRWMDGWI